MITSQFRRSSKVATSGASPDAGVTSWRSLITLNEEANEEEDCEDVGTAGNLAATRSKSQRTSGDDTCSMIVPQASSLVSAVKKMRPKSKGKKHFRRSYGSEIFNRTALGLDTEEESSTSSKEQQPEQESHLPSVPESQEGVATPDVSSVAENADEKEEEGEKEDAGKPSTSTSTGLVRRQSIFKRKFLHK